MPFTSAHFTLAGLQHHYGRSCVWPGSQWPQSASSGFRLFLLRHTAYKHDYTDVQQCDAWKFVHVCTRFVLLSSGACHEPPNSVAPKTSDSIIQAPMAAYRCSQESTRHIFWETGVERENCLDVLPDVNHASFVVVVKNVWVHRPGPSMLRAHRSHRVPALSPRSCSRVPEYHKRCLVLQYAVNVGSYGFEPCTDARVAQGCHHYAARASLAVAQYFCCVAVIAETLP